MKKHLLLVICTIFLAACSPKAEDISILTTEPSYSASLSSNGEFALVATQNSGVQCWDLSTHTLKYQWIHGDINTGVTSTAISPNGAFAASLSRDSVAIWRMADGKSLGWWSLPSSGESVAVADNGALLVGLNDGSVMSLNSARSALIKFLGHKDRVNSVALSADGRLALTGSNDMQAILWQAQTGQPLHTWTLSSRITKVALNESGSLSFTNGSTNEAKIWDNTSGNLLNKLDIQRRQMNFSAVRFVNNDTQILTGTPAREVILWQRGTGKEIGKWQISLTKNSQSRGAVVYSVAIRDTNKVVSISSQGLVETWQQ
ncbi:WD40 repeat domain-containing protein [Shewanella glacialipiscicola]|uniref:WD40 repeat domain-containing protein n=1 Tax=Shewanella glacialipiscicola TaxID=614069 RepID=UPI003D7B0F34